MEFDNIGKPLTSFQEHYPDTIPDLFASENDHMPSQSFSTSPSKTRDFYVSFRREAISLIFQAQFSCNFDPFVSYLAVNYMDRFVSKQEITQEKPWLSKLLVVASISLAAKMSNSPFSLSHIQGEEGFNFDAQTVHKMEVLILDTLSWRMRSITPFSFLCFFVSLFELNDPTLTQALKDRASETIYSAHNEMKFLEFKPSIIAASAILSASHELFPLQFSSFKASISDCQYVDTESLLKCLNLMQEMVMMQGYESILETVSSSRTPMSVLDRHFMMTNSESDNTCSNTTTTTTTDAIAVAEKRQIKRRKLSDFCSKSGFQISQSNQW
ncbi:putative cyclin-D6-1 [Ziziphus jujuba]|uniref:B-like cyclin n=2 Tax=Ziziphus jujuba TaxID=326968 RepID=A0A6P3ZYG0_ZIZJJ|nr:putative cyclin-D6-1 [Ziziphus jujuba]KAH7545892.1 hypothetical protein FEM48_Zijuj01G0141700 [Ziziphus jujuba var. spinosa]